MKKKINFLLRWFFVFFRLLSLLSYFFFLFILLLPWQWEDEAKFFLVCGWTRWLVLNSVYQFFVMKIYVAAKLDWTSVYDEVIWEWSKLKRSKNDLVNSFWPKLQTKSKFDFSQQSNLFKKAFESFKAFTNSGEMIANGRKLICFNSLRPKSFEVFQKSDQFRKTLNNFFTFLFLQLSTSIPTHIFNERGVRNNRK